MVNEGHLIFNVTITFYNIIQQRSLWKIKQNYAIGDLNGNDIDRMICKIILSDAKFKLKFIKYLFMKFEFKYKKMMFLFF